MSKQESILVGCVPPACQPYDFWPPDVSTARMGFQLLPPDVTSRGTGGSHGGWSDVQGIV